MKKIISLNEDISQEIHHGLAKIEINGSFLGPKIKKITQEEYLDETEIFYHKDLINNLLIIHYQIEENEIQSILLKGFHEGDYGIWLERVPPYFIKDGYIVGKYEKIKDKIGKVKNESGNEWLSNEERIINDFLWIMADEKIIFPETAEKLNEKEIEEIKNKESGVSSSNSDQSEDDETEENKEGKTALNPLLKSMSAGGGGGGKALVVSGAKLKCNFGDKEGSLTVLPSNKVTIQNKPLATMMDSKPMVNIAPFGKCKCIANPIVAAATAANYGRLQSMPCIPATGTPWMNGCTKVMVKNIFAINEKSQTMCMWGGIIQITKAGQKKVKGK